MKDELQLQRDLAVLEAKTRTLLFGMKIGWLPFAFVAAILGSIGVIAVAIGGSLFENTDTTQTAVVVGLVVDLLTLVAFYAILFNRQTKLYAEISKKRLALRMEMEQSDD